MAANYEIELWGKNGAPLANIRQFCSSLKWTKKLNDAEELSFSIDLHRYEELLEKLGFSNAPFGLLDVGSHDIRIKRNGQYLFGANIIKVTYSSDTVSVKMDVSCYGYLNYYKYRYITKKYTKTAQEEILFNVIETCNNTPGGDYGVRRGEVFGESKIRRDRTYDRKEVKSLIQQMSGVIGGPDFDFTADKHLNIYEAKGTYRPSVRLVYPGNIGSFSFDRSVEKVSNFVTALGSGNGENVLVSTASDINSAAQLYRREKIVQYNSVSIQSTLDQHSEAVLHYTKDIIELPAVTVPDGVLDLNEVDVGDTIHLSLTGSSSLKHIDGDYRIMVISCDVDDNDSETVSLEFDSIDIEDIISKQDEEEGNES